MKKAFKYYITGWAVVLVLFNLIAFLFGGIENEVKYTPPFWIGYAFITLAFIVQLIIAYFAFKQDTAKKVFYNIPLVRISYSGLIASLIFGALSMAIPVLPYWAGVIVDGILTAVVLVAVMKAKAAADLVTSLDETIKKQTQFIQALTADAEILVSHAKSEEAKSECQKVYEAIRYSDPMSSDVLGSIESRITIAFNKLNEAVSAEQTDAIKETANEVIVLVEDRNKKCKILK